MSGETATYEHTGSVQLTISQTSFPVFGRSLLVKLILFHCSTLCLLTKRHWWFHQQQFVCEKEKSTRVFFVERECFSFHYLYV